ncbi:Cytochrome P450 [Mycena venus]|uniref:Cytochrome P450 n=1 Tax=Mycena venus TaxID=2733690 RepID=A0A8H6YQM5_9AGAR|nr:Cytochrome P450 [Mycena venus]
MLASKLSSFEHLLTVHTLALCIALAIFFYAVPFLVRINLVDQAGRHPPPGPFLRCACLGKHSELLLDHWAKRFGPLFSVWMGNQLVVVISDPRVAQDLLVENGAIFSSRKPYFIKNQVILHHRAITAAPYNDVWRHHRKLAVRFLSENAVQGYTDSIEYEVLTLLRSLHIESHSCASPINPALFAVRFTLNNMLKITFGIRTSSLSDSLLHRIQGWVVEFDEIAGGLSNAVDFIKPLQYLPSRTRTRGMKLNADMTEVFGGMIQEMQRRIENAEYVPDCLIKTLLETPEEEKLEFEDILMLAVAFAFGGVHSIAGIIQWFLALMAMHPTIAAAAHAEVDRVVGRERLPTITDEMNMPYVRAIIKEVQRLHAPFWIPTPHFSTADFAYQGMFIPKATVVVLNCWTIHHNEERYPDPFAFKPHRYLGDNLSNSASSKLADPRKRDHWIFGAGRRICPGLVLAERELWLAISGLIWAYTFHQVPEEPIALEKYEAASGRTPLPFMMRLIPRREEARQLLETEKGMVGESICGA